MSERSIGILQPGYLPWLGFFEQQARTDLFVYYDDVQFAKGSWANRNRIKTAQGIAFLTVPVLIKGHSCSSPIRDMRINSSVNWQKKHLQSLRQSYARAPYFDCIFPPLAEALSRTHDFLLDFDLELLEILRNLLGLHTPVRLASELGIAGKGTERLVAIVTALGGTRFYEGAAGRNYIDASLFKQRGIALEYQDYAHPIYPQLHGDFVSHLSVVDLLFNCGPESLRILSFQNSKHFQENR